MGVSYVTETSEPSVSYRKNRVVACFRVFELAEANTNRGIFISIVCMRVCICTIICPGEMIDQFIRE